MLCTDEFKRDIFVLPITVTGPACAENIPQSSTKPDEGRHMTVKLNISVMNGIYENT